MMNIYKFVDNLALEKVDELVVKNIYSKDCLDNTIRVNNLIYYLEHFLNNKPDLILIGEAPGYRGCSISGIPFTSNKLMGSLSLFKNILIEGNKYLETEATSTIVWEYIQSTNKKIMLWNAYPFHPFIKDRPFLNRKPTKAELLIGKNYLDFVIKIFPEAKLVAVGKVAHNSLQKMGYKVHHVRHPSYGGKHDFILGLNNLT